MVTLPDTKNTVLSLSGGWLTIALNTPENRNALSEDTVRELLQTFSAIKEDRTVRGVTLRGEGGVFCAGGDLKAFALSLSGGIPREDVAAMNLAGAKLFRTVAQAPQTVIALVEGAAVAGGLGLMCCADIAVATRSAKFALTETQLGITPAQIAPYVVERIGRVAAKRLMLTAARFDGANAVALGLVDRIVDDAAGLDAEESEIRRAVLNCAPGANAATKALVMKTQNLSGEAFADHAAGVFADCLLSDEGREGVAAFAMKRKPYWAPKDD
ncbi:MAG: enoyl-CoA hydratase-related protein [Pseudomonadota bacterium]